SRRPRGSPSTAGARSVPSASSPASTRICSARRTCWPSSGASSSRSGNRRRRRGDTRPSRPRPNRCPSAWPPRVCGRCCESGSDEIARLEGELADVVAELEVRERELDEAEQRFRTAEDERRQVDDARRRIAEEAAARRAEIEATRRSVADTDAESGRLRSELA